MHAATASPVERTPLYRFVAPRYWRVWIILALMRLVYLLPLGVQRALGARAGRLAMRWLHERREIGRRNLAVCFPELDENARDELIKGDSGILTCPIEAIVS